MKVNIHPESHLAIAVINAARKAKHMSAVNFTTETFAQGARAAVDEMPDSDIIKAWHSELAGDFARASQKMRIDDPGAHVGTYRVGEIDLEGFPALTDAATSILTNPNLTGLFMDFKDTYAYAILQGNLNGKEIRMKPKERWYLSSASLGEEEYTVHPNDVSAWFDGDNPQDENFFFHTESYVFWLIEIGITHEEITRQIASFKWGKEQYEKGLITYQQFQEFDYSNNRREDGPRPQNAKISQERKNIDTLVQGLVLIGNPDWSHFEK